METTLKIKNFEDKVSQKTNKAYTRFDTSQGWVSVFEKDIIQSLKDNVNKKVNVVLAVNGSFKNIRKFIGVCEEQEESNSFAGAKVTKDNEYTEIDPQKWKRVSVCVSYAKDLCCAGALKRDQIDTAAVTFYKMTQKIYDEN